VLNQDVAGGSSISREYAFSLNGSTLAPGERLLEIADIDLRFGGIQALDGVGLTVAQGNPLDHRPQRRRQVEPHQ
jgi:hypothetical protein